MPVLKFKNFEDWIGLKKKVKVQTGNSPLIKFILKRPLDFKPEFHFPQGCINL